MMSNGVMMPNGMGAGYPIGQMANACMAGQMSNMVNFGLQQGQLGPMNVYQQQVEATLLLPP